MTNRLAATAALCCVAVGGCAVTTPGTATPAGPVPLTTEAALPTVLLSAADVGSTMGGGELVVTREVSAPWDDGGHLSVRSDPGCLAVAGAAQRDVYAGTGWTGMRGQVLREPPPALRWSHFATQAVVLFPTVEAASDFYARSAGSWAGCSDRELTYAAQPAPEQVWSVGPSVTDRDVLTVSRSQRSPQQWSCSRALTVRGNVAVDVEACRLDGPTDAAAAIARAIGDRLPDA